MVYLFLICTPKCKLDVHVTHFMTSRASSDASSEDAVERRDAKRRRGVVATTVARGDGFGIRLAVRGDCLLIAGVEEASSADHAGLHAGLVVRTVSCPSGSFEPLDADCASLRACVRVLSSAGRVTLHCEEATAAELGAGASRCEEAEAAPVSELRPCLSLAEVDEVHAVARALRQRPHVYESSPQHEAKFLHAGGHFARAAPALCEKLLALMRRRWPSPCAVRCVEYHEYRPGGALLDAGHRDVGSNLTLSVLLSDPRELGGGIFTTYCGPDAAPVRHELGLGDAVLFHSERVHHVTPVTRGVRHALVIELWNAARGDNERDRHG